MGATIATPLRRHRLVASSLTITGLTIVARLATAARELLVAGQYGVSTDADGYFVAVALPAVLASAVWIALQVAAVPAEAAVRADGGTPNDLLVPLVRTVGRRLGLVSLGIVVLSWPIVAALGSGFRRAHCFTGPRPPGDHGSDRHAVGICRGAERVAHRTTAFRDVSRRTGDQRSRSDRRVSTLADRDGDHGRRRRRPRGVPSRRSWSSAWWSACPGVRSSPSPKTVHAQPRSAPRSRMATPLVVATLVTSSSAIIDQGMAGTLPSGSVGALAYASRIVLFAAIPLVAISTAVFPALAEQIVDGGEARWRRGQVAHRARQIVLPGVVLVPVVIIGGRFVVEQIITSSSDTSVSTVVGTLSGLHADAPGVRGLVLVASRAHRAEPQPVGAMSIAVASHGRELRRRPRAQGSLRARRIAASTVIVQTAMCVALALAVNLALDPADSDRAKDHVET